MQKYCCYIALLLPWVFSCGNAKKSPELSGKSKVKIVYNILMSDSTQRHENWDIYWMNEDGSEAKPLIKGKGKDWVYCSCGSNIYFLSDKDTTYGHLFLYEMDLSTGKERKITNYPVQDSYFNTRYRCSEFIVAKRVEKKSHLFIIDANGNIEKQLTSDSIRGTDAVFSPDGKQIAFKSYRSGNSEIWIMDENGRGLRQLTLFPTDDKKGNRGTSAIQPFWEPNQNIISFSSQRNGIFGIFSIRPDGSGLQQITDNAVDAIGHTWNAEGTLMVFDGSLPGSRNTDLFLWDAQTRKTTRLTNDPKLEMGPVFVEVGL